MNFNMDIYDRIYARLDFDNHKGCWLYNGADNGKGYKRIYADGRMQSVHRLMYVLRYGEIPQGKEIHHTCLNRNCVCPDHLEAISHRENVARTEVYERLRLARLRLLIATEESLRELGKTCLTSRRLCDLWDCRTDNVPTILSTMTLVYGEDFQWEIALEGRGRRPTLFTIKMEPALVNKLIGSIENDCQPVDASSLVSTGHTSLQYSNVASISL